MRPLDGARGLRPDQALRAMLEGGGRGDVVRLLVAVLGVYPVGSLVRLSRGQLAVVLTAPPAGASPTRPVVRVIEEQGAAASYVVELAKHPELHVEAGVEPREQGLNVVHFLLA